MVMGRLVCTKCHGARFGRCRARWSPPLQLGAAQSLLEAQVLRLIYIDNFSALALTQGAADQVSKTMLERLQTLRVDAVAEQDDDPLLWFVLSFDGSYWRPTPCKFWRVALTLRSLASRRVLLYGLQISRVSGHAKSLFGLRRERRAIFAHG